MYNMIMIKKQNGFIGIGAIMIIVVAIVIVGIGYFVLKSENSNSPAQTTTTSDSSKIQESFTQSEAFKKLKQAYAAKVKVSQEDCPSYDKSCLSSSLADNDKFPIAKAYGATTDPGDSIYFGLEKGKSLDIRGIGTGYLNNKSKLMIADDEWYWEIGACSTNNRIFINAKTGETAGIHNWTYCSRNIDELSAPN